MCDQLTGYIFILCKFTAYCLQAFSCSPLHNFFAQLHVLDQFFILNLPELTSQIYSRCSYLKIVDFNGAFSFKKLSLEISLNGYKDERG